MPVTSLVKNIFLPRFAALFPYFYRFSVGFTSIAVLLSGMACVGWLVAEITIATGHTPALWNPFHSSYSFIPSITSYLSLAFFFVYDVVSVLAAILCVFGVVRFIFNFGSFVLSLLRKPGKAVGGVN